MYFGKYSRNNLKRALKEKKKKGNKMYHKAKSASLIRSKMLTNSKKKLENVS